MSADSCALGLGISVRAYERVLRFKGLSRFALLSLLSWLLLMAQTTSTVKVTILFERVEDMCTCRTRYCVFRVV